MTITAGATTALDYPDELAALLTGSLVLPDSAEFAMSAFAWNVAITSTPLAVVHAADAADVQATVEFANRCGLAVDVRNTGHGATHDGSGTILIRTAALDEMELHAAEQWVRVGAGVRWASVIAAAAPFGLAPLCGSAPDVGVVGLTTGGGLGPVARSFGVSSDRVRAIEVVTGDGEHHRVTPTENPELFWGLRGGKGALGIVTAIEFDLVPLATLLGGALFFSAEDGGRIVERWAEWCLTLPEAATTSVAIYRLPPMPGVPAPIAGVTTVALRFAWTGDVEEGRAALQPMLEVANPVFGGIDVMPYAAVGMIHADPVDPMPTYDAAALLHSLPHDAVASLLAVAGPDTDCPQLMVELRQLGGAVAREPRTPDALDHRDAPFVLNVIGIGVGPGLVATAANTQAVLASVTKWTTGGAFPNFAASDDYAHLRSVYVPETLMRLGGLAVTYDPHEVIRASWPIRRALLGDDD